MKKAKNPGDNISLKTKKNELPAVMEWLNCQTNLMDSIRYLIENEISSNGIRNLQQYIPAERNIAALAQRQSVNSEDTFEIRSERVEAIPAEDDIDEEDIDSWT